MKTIVLLGLIVATFSATFAVNLPDFIHVCKRDNPNMGNCIKESVESLKSYLRDGIPEYKIIPLEPLKLDELSTTAGENIKLKLTDITVYGASNFTISNMKANGDPLKIVTELLLPSLLVEGNYDVDGKLLLLRIRGNGPMKCHFVNCKGLVKFQLVKVKGEDGQVYLSVNDLKTKVAIGSGSMHLENLFGGDQTLGEAVNSAINSNFNSFIKEIKPSLEGAISRKFNDIANGIVSQFTYDDLFPES